MKLKRTLLFLSMKRIPQIRDGDNPVPVRYK